MLVFNGQMMLDLTPASTIATIRGCFIESLRISKLLNVIVRFKHDDIFYLVGPNDTIEAFESKMDEVIGKKICTICNENPLIPGLWFCKACSIEQSKKSLES